MKKVNIKTSKTEVSITCPNCQNWEEQSIDEQRHHFGTFLHFEWSKIKNNDVSKTMCDKCGEEFLLVWDYDTKSPKSKSQGANPQKKQTLGIHSPTLSYWNHKYISKVTKLEWYDVSYRNDLCDSISFAIDEEEVLHLYLPNSTVANEDREEFDTFILHNADGEDILFTNNIDEICDEILRCIKVIEEKRRGVLEVAKSFRDAMAKLNGIWKNNENFENISMLINAYPLKGCFDDLTLDVNRWIEDIEENIKVS